LTEYIGDPRNPDGFKEEYVVEEVLPAGGRGGAWRRYSFEGVLEDPLAWVEWDIEAMAFELDVDEMGTLEELYLFYGGRG